jgi:hypothetical protein
MALVLPIAYTVEVKDAECEANEMIAKTTKSPRLAPPSTSPCAGAETFQPLDLVGEFATIGDFIIAATKPSRGTLTLAQLYHPIRQSRNKKPSTPQPQEDPVKNTMAGIIGTSAASSSHDILNLANHYRPRLQKRNNQSSFQRKVSYDCSTNSLLISSSYAAEQIWEEINNDIANKDEDDWSFTGSSHRNSKSLSVGYAEDKDAMIPAAIAVSQLVNEAVPDGNRKRKRMSH